MRKYLLIVWILPLLLIVGCSGLSVGPTGDSANDATAAQRFLPDIPGYSGSDADSITDALTGVSGGATAISGNPALAGLISTIDGMIQCYQDVGAVSARVYTPASIDPTDLNSLVSTGAVAVVNQDRLSRNLLNCVVGGGAQTFSAQAVQPCGGSGSVVVDGETIAYIYAATNTDLCTAFQQAFDRLG